MLKIIFDFLFTSKKNDMTGTIREENLYVMSLVNIYRLDFDIVFYQTMRHDTLLESDTIIAYILFPMSIYFFDIFFRHDF